MLKKWSKLSLIFFIMIMSYAIIQLICSVSYVIVQKGLCLKRFMIL